MSLPNEPYTRREVYLSNIAGQNTALPAEPYTREEEYLDYIAKNGSGGGTGEGDMKKSVYDNDLAVSSAGGIKAYVTGAIADKVDKVDGKGLSTNDYDDSAKAIVDGVTTALDGKVSKSNTAGLLKNDGSVDTTTTSAVSANTTAISNIKDGTSIDSFSDVETALSGKENTISDLSTIRSGASAGATAYQKPNDGIPKTDLASAVQTSLSKADSAVQDISGKADKVASATNGNFAGLDSNGNLTDSGKKSSDFATAASVTAIEGKIPSGASSSNKMATASDVAAKISWADAGKSVKKNYLNVFPANQTQNTVTLVNNEDKSVTLNGTPSAQTDFYYAGTGTPSYGFLHMKTGSYKVTCEGIGNTANLSLFIVPQSGDLQVVDSAHSEITFEHDATKMYRLFIRVGANVALSNRTLKVMFRPASVLDNTYAAPIPDNTELMTWEANAVLGAKNFFYWDRTPTTPQNDLVITRNADGSVRINGTASAHTYIQLSDLLIDGSFIGSGCPAGGSNETYYMQFTRRNEAGTADEVNYMDYGNGVNIETVKTKKLRPFIVVKKDTVIDKVFYPMLRLATDTDPTYAPYAMTNKELTEKWKPQTGNITDGLGTASYSHLYKVGNLVMFDHRTNGVTANAWSPILTLPSGFRPEENIRGTFIITTDNSQKVFSITASDGKFTTVDALSNAEVLIHAMWYTAS